MTANRLSSTKKTERFGFLKRISTSFLLATAVLLIAMPVVFAQQKKKPKKKTKPKTEKQDKSTLTARKNNLQADIDLTNKLLKQTRRNKTLSLSQLVALNKKIEAREALIGEINTEISELDQQISENNKAVAELDSQIVRLKRDYARMVVAAYRHRDSYEMTLFLFSAKSINQAFMRMHYMQQVNNYRREKAQGIMDMQLERNEEIRNLEDQKSEKKNLLGSEESEKQELAMEKDDKDKTFRELQSKEEQLKSDIEKKKKEKESIDNAIQDLIAAEIKAKAAAATKPKTASNPKTGNSNTANNPKPPVGSTGSTGSATPKTNPVPPPTPEGDAIGKSFAENQGRLIWPVAQGAIIGHFGKQPHPVLKGVFVNNNGIDISTTEDASARAVFDGEVTGVTNIPGSGWLVIVRHGEYLTVYAKLENVAVKNGDKVKAKQTIGKISNDSEEGQTILHFEVWKSGIGKIDPELWLLRGGRS